MKTTGIVFSVLGIISFIGCLTAGRSVFGPCFWIAIGALLTYKGKEREERKKKEMKSDEELYNMCKSIEEMSKDPNFLAAGVYNKEEMEENLKRWYRQEFRAEGIK